MTSRRAPRIVGASLVAAVASGHALAAQETIRTSVDSSGAEVDRWSYGHGLSEDGRFAVFTGESSKLVAGDTNGSADVFVHDLANGVTERVSVDSTGAQGNGWSVTSTWKRISGDGSRVVFASGSTNLAPNDTNGLFDVFVRDRSNGTTTRVSVDSSGAEADRACANAGISEDGLLVFFYSDATNLVANDTNGLYDAFVHDLTTGTTERVSVDSGGTEGNGDSFGMSISSDGRFVLFMSRASNLVTGDQNHSNDLFVRDRWSGTTERVSIGANGVEGNGGSDFGSISGDGNLVAFVSTSSNLVAGDTNSVADVFVRDRTAGTTTRASVDSSGVQCNGLCDSSDISSDGRLVAFYSRATNLVAGDTNGVGDAFVHDSSTGATIRVSVDSSGVESNGDTGPTDLTADGRMVAMESSASNLVPNDTNGVVDCFVYEFCDSPAAWTNYGAGYSGTLGVPTISSRQLPSFGATITVDLTNSYGAPTIGLLVVGVQRASLPTGRGGDLLVLPTLIVPISFAYGADSFTGTIPDDVALCGAIVDLQGIEADPGAAFGVSFSAGLELVIGN